MGSGELSLLTDRAVFFHKGDYTRLHGLLAQVVQKTSYSLRRPQRRYALCYQAF